ncbi:PREDICTED: angiopoietin-2-like isoform X1 [Rhagoletis zephyria]|uniref:angiopoietin-2-like isoform X1 n=1 Tax=Rhagoletis zephyria TaxID=28612 RepID=UPI0008116E4E|nr:PREDICTED: angiopoietin-2-like isoform X1 [Rhagoletis zephyria]
MRTYSVYIITVILWSTVFLFSIVHILPVNAAILTNATTADLLVNLSTSSNDCANALKLDHLNHALKQIDGAVQNLEEKAHNWAIFRHHIDAWNDQIKSLEHKLDLVKRAQDEQQAYGNKLISLEFTLNHILSKVVYLSDACNTHQGTVAYPSAAIRPPVIFNAHMNSNGNDNDNGRDTTQQQQQKQDTNELLYEHIALLGDVKHAIGIDKQLRGELSTRLSNILRHVQNIERDNCGGERRHFTSNAKDKANGHSNGNANNKMAKLMAPIGGCNSNQNIERALKSLGEQVSTLSAQTSTPKESKQLHTLTKKNSQQLENVINFLNKVDERLLQWRDESTLGWHQCQAMSGELSTFTESSDLLLKRIEMLVHEVNEKLAKQPVAKSGNKDDENDGSYEVEDVAAVDDHRADEEGKIDDSGEVVLTKHVNGNMVPTKNVDVEEQTEKIDDRFDVIDFLQPEKTACHDLNAPPVDGVYKFFTPELNEAGRDFNERYCSFATEGAAWTVIHNRGPYDEHENFNRSWVEYRNGFGELNKEFWFGNEFIHQLVDRDDYELRIELTDFEEAHVWAEYSFFRLDSERYNYNLLIGGYSGTVPDAMHYHNEMDFSTYDRRNDKSVDACCACATGYASGWWFDNCSEANLNGIYRETPSGHNYVGIIWEQWRGDYSLQKARMMIRPKNLSTEEQLKHSERRERNEDP